MAQENFKRKPTTRGKWRVLYVRMPDKLHAQIMAISKKHGRSSSNLINRFLEACIASGKLK